MPFKKTLSLISGFILGLLVAWFYWREGTRDQAIYIHHLENSLRDSEQRLQKTRLRLQEVEAASKETTAPSHESASPAPIAEPDNLRRIEGIGPKISQVLQSAGITTFQQLAATEVSKIEQILRDAGNRLSDPGTWPEQAQLAADGDWAGLAELQRQLKGGRRV